METMEVPKFLPTWNHELLALAGTSEQGCLLSCLSSTRLCRSLVPRKWLSTWSAFNICTNACVVG